MKETEQGDGPIDSGQALELVGRILRRSRDHLKQAEAASDAAREELEAAGEDMRQQLAFSRRLLGGSYGPEITARILGASAPAGSPPLALWRQGRELAAVLRNGELDRGGGGLVHGQLDTEAMADVLERAAARLESAIEANELERRKRRAAVGRRAVAVAGVDDGFRAALRLALNLCRSAGQPELARRIKGILRKVAPGRNQT